MHTASSVLISRHQVKVNQMTEYRACDIYVHVRWSLKWQRVYSNTLPSNLQHFKDSPRRHKISLNTKPYWEHNTTPTHPFFTVNFQLSRVRGREGGYGTGYHILSVLPGAQSTTWHLFHLNFVLFPFHFHFSIPLLSFLPGFSSYKVSSSFASQSFL